MPRVRQHVTVARLGGDRAFSPPGAPPADYRSHEERMIDRIGGRIKPDPSTGCWEWTGSVDPDGYGVIVTGTAEHRAHRAVFAIMRGTPIAKRTHAHHMCQVRHCVNPDHIELLSASDHKRAHWAQRNTVGWLSHHGTPRPDPDCRR